jgi:ABC-2 type transport system permease protein
MIVRYLFSMAAAFRSLPLMLFSLSQPIFWLLLFAAIAPEGDYFGSSVNAINYLTPGIIIMTIYFGASYFGAGSIEEKRNGILDRMLLSRISPYSILYGRLFANMTMLYIQVAFIFIMAVFLGFDMNSWFHFLVTALFVVPGIGIVLGLISELIASFFDRQEGFIVIVQFFSLPLIFLSGFGFPIPEDATSIRFISSLNPLTYAVEALQIASMQSKIVYHDIILLYAIGAILIGIITWMYHRRFA